MAKQLTISQQTIIDICDTLGDALRMMRIAAQMSQEDLAEEIGVNRQSIFRYETNRTRPNPAHLYQIIRKTCQTTNEMAQKRLTIDTMQNVVKKYYRRKELATS